MRIFSALFLVSSLMFALPGAAAQFSRTGDGVCVYEHVNFQGWEKCYTAGDEVSNLGSVGDSISSIRIYGRARVMVFQDSNFRGDSIELTSSVPDLGRPGVRSSSPWNDRIHSLFVTGANGARGGGGGFGGFGGFGGNDRRPQEEGVCVYENRNYQGRAYCWDRRENIRDLGSFGGWSDNISSIRVFGDAAARFYQNIDFRGEYIEVDRDVPDLAQVRARGFQNWNDQISSVQVDAGRDRGRFGR